MEEQKKKDTKTLIKVLLCDFAILDVVLAAIFLIKYFRERTPEDSGYGKCLTALKATLDKRESQGWSRPSSLLTYDSTYGSESHSFSYTESPYNLVIDGSAYGGADAQSKIDEAFALYSTYDCKDGIRGLISLMETRKENIESATYTQTAQEGGYYTVSLVGSLNSEGTLTSLTVGFNAHMYAKDIRVIGGVTSSITWSIG